MITDNPLAEYSFWDGYCSYADELRSIVHVQVPTNQKPRRWRRQLACI